MTNLAVAISPCPNDTYAFYGLLSGAVEVPGVEIDFTFADIQELNEGMRTGAWDIAKGSIYAGLQLSASYRMLPVGAALGYGVGPLLLGAPGQREVAGDSRVLCPGEWTTASLLYRLFYPDRGQIEQRVFSDIMPALERKEADFGVCIHEGRFTWRGRGLERVEDLGERWEEETGGPLPLGGLFAHRCVEPAVALRFSEALARSIEWADMHPAYALETMRQYAQEQSTDVLWAHVELYVNRETRGLSPTGQRALETLGERASAAGAIPADAPALQLLGRS